MSISYRKVISIIPGGTPQFLDFTISKDSLEKAKINFLEYFDLQKENEHGSWHLKTIINSDDGKCLDADNMEPIDFSNYDSKEFNVNIEKVLETYIGEWLPFPIFRLAGSVSGMEKRYRAGPTNWARVRITKKDNNYDDDFNYHLSVAFDTYIENGDPYSQSAYGALTENDVSEGAEFGFAYKLKDLRPFLSNSWVKDWLEYLFEEGRRKKYINRRVPDPEFRTEFIARYVAFLEFINNLNIIPIVKIIDIRRNRPIDVDLVLDIGNARTIGMLIEKPSGEDLALTNGSTLELRDLSSSAHRIYTGTFSSNICFAKADFGDINNFSRGSSRMRQAFTWPSVVRTGQEASDLSAISRRDQGQTSLSSPKRYLWDLSERLSGDGWRYSPRVKEPFSEELPVNSGDFVGFINNQGMPIDNASKRFISPVLRNIDIGDRFPVTEPNFSRSSMMMFLLSEIISHALVQINSPENRDKRGSPEIPRRLTRIIMTVPPAMSVSERKIMEFWARSAIDILWKAKDWEELSKNSNDYRSSPSVSLNLDEASATQIVFIYNEIAEKFSGNSREYFQQFGKIRNEFDVEPSLRIGSIDIGGGATDMVVTTYLNETRGVSNNIVTRQNFRESFHVAGDDILKKLIEKIIIPGIIDCLSSENIKNKFKRLFTDNKIDISQKQKVLRTQITMQILYPIGISILTILSRHNIQDLESTSEYIRIGDVVNQNKLSIDVKNFIDEVTGLDKINDDLLNQKILIDLDAAAVLIIGIIGPYLDDLCEVANKYDCDFLLLSGWPSCLPIIRSYLLKNPPLCESRIISMSQYRVENWYPFITPKGIISDPKTTGVVGALLSAISEGNLLNFRFNTSDLRPASTIRYIGPMGIDRQIKSLNIMFQGIDLIQNTEEVIETDFEFTTPTYIGYRQFHTERWKTTPFYYLRFSDPIAAERASRRGLPYRLSLSYNREIDEEMDSNYENEGYIKIEEITAADGSYVSKEDLIIQLKSLWEADGYWLDTGLFDVQ